MVSQSIYQSIALLTWSVRLAVSYFPGIPRNNKGKIQKKPASLEVP